MLEAHVERSDIELEQLVLSALLSGRTDANGEEHASVLCDIARASDFSSAMHRLIFETIHAMVRAHTPVGADTVCAELRARERINTAGGEEYIGNLANSPARLDYAQSAVASLRRLARVRNLWRASMLVSDIFASNAPSSEALEQAETVLGAALDRDDSDEHSFESLVQGVAGVTSACSNKKPSLSVYTGFAPFDRATDGLETGGLAIIAGESGGGKTALAIQLGIGLAEATQKCVLGFELEMPAEQIWNRVTAANALVPHTAIKHRDVEQAQMDRMYAFEERAGQIPFALHKPKGKQPTIDQMVEIARSFKRRAGSLAAVIIDFAQFVKGRARENEERHIANVADTAKTMAMELECIVILLSQLTLPPDFKGRPTKDMLRGSRDLSHLASCIALLHPGKLRQSGHREIELLVDKNRNGQKKTCVNLLFHEATVRFYGEEEVEPDHVAPSTPPKPRPSKYGNGKPNGDAHVD